MWDVKTLVHLLTARQKENGFNYTAARALVGMRHDNLSIAPCLTSYPAENRNVLESSPSLATSSDMTDPTPTTTNHTGLIVGSKQISRALSPHNLMFFIPFTGVVGGLAAIALTVTLVWIFFNRKHPANRRVVLERNPSRAEESPLSPGPHSPPIITRVSSPRGPPIR